MTRKELISLGRKIVEAKGTESELNSLIVLFNSNVPHPNGSNLFYYPENYNARRDDISKYNPTVEEIVDKCLSYKAIQL
ncbi:bacteriocin immunity protein [Maribacter polysaccharolyticus]|uniref:bacteriocin immunity protein n=1 Tax=Maribacter polysaccharolyticus TaxID=3020831 RepID=UPI00237F0B18|nr:bacteriocin immunity protein [Maribacter polysaccharolyticus]MDE3743302.1 bacteriocin immunity protein [Maribacter polysaccharolyticus]|tara:strand:+ start:806 stop:1042 length:237 start_codon:yes stop_codon:yes gene_type:complete